MAKTYRTRPSEMFQIADGYTALCFDRAVFSFGSALESELESIEGKNEKETARKRERTLHKWLDIPLKYRNPAATR